MMRTCPCCGTMLEEVGPGALDQCGEYEVPALVLRCPGPRCADTVVLVPTGEAPRPAPRKDVTPCAT